MSDITGVRSQRVGLCLCPCKGCGKSLRVSTSGGGGRGSGMRDRGSESRWCRGRARAASGWWVGPNGKNSRSNLGGVCVGGREGYPSEHQTLTNWFGQLDAGRHGRGGGGERGASPRRVGPVMPPPRPSCPIGEICLGVWSWHRLCALVHIGSYVLRPIEPHRRQRRRTKEKLTGHQTKWRLKCCPQRRRRW